MVRRAVPDRRFTAEQVDAAVAALMADPGRFGHAQEVVTHAAPGLQGILDAALHEGGWYGEAHATQVAGAAGVEDAEQRALAVRTLIAEETRIAMLIGVAVGLELSTELNRGDPEP
jgi:hypothetical protein